MAYYFFFSYARESDSPQLRAFFKDLNFEVATLARWPEDQAGFIDTHQRRGDDWDENIASVLATVKVMVCLYTPAYFSKEYCGKEVEVMLRRRRAFRAQHPVARPSNIIPILWDPCKDAIAGRDYVARTLPPFFVSREPGSVYENEGLRFMLEAGDHQPRYVALKRSITRDIIAAASQFRLPEEQVPLRIGMVRNAFLPQPVSLQPAALGTTVFGPTSLLCLYVGPAGWHSDAQGPFRPPDEDAAPFVCAAVAESVETQPREFALDPNVSSSMEVLEHIARKNGRVIVIIDSRVVDAAPFNAWLRRSDERAFPNCATIVIGEVTRTKVEKALPRAASRPPQFFHSAVTRADDLARAMVTSLQALHDYITSISDASSVIDRPTSHTSLPSLVVPAA